MTEMLNPGVEIPAIHGAYETMAAERGLTYNGEFVNDGPPTWVGILRDSEGQPAMASHLHLTANPEETLVEERRRVTLLNKLYDNGAPVHHYLEEPHTQPKRGGSSKLGLVATHSEYLESGKDVGPEEYGNAAALHHNASLHVDLSEAPVIDQLAAARGAVEVAKGLRRPLQTDEAILTTGLVDFMEERLEVMTAVQASMNQLARSKGRRHVSVQEDLHGGNVMRKGTRAILIDCDGYTGVPEGDLGRVDTDWRNRFADAMDLAPGYVQGYESQIAPELAPDEEIRDLAAMVSNTRFSMAMITLALRDVELGMPPKPWLINEGVHRLKVIDQHDVLWNPWNSAQKKKSALKD